MILAFLNLLLKIKLIMYETLIENDHFTCFNRTWWTEALAKTSAAW
jgi:hypothetical protein